MSLVRLSRPVMLCLAIPLALFLAIGCGPKASAKRVLPQPPPKDTDRWARETAKRLRDLERETNQLNMDSQALPGQDSADHSRIMQRVFSDLLRTLPLLADPTTDRVLAQRMSIIDNSRAQLANGAGNLAIEPAIDTALRAAGAALGDISHGENYQQADVGATLDKLSAQLNRLDTERDSNLHRVDVAGTVDLTSQVVNKLAAAIGAKLTGTAAATTAPAAPSSEMPAPAIGTPVPATAPVSQPATTQPAATPDAK